MARGLHWHYLKCYHKDESKTQIMYSLNLLSGMQPTWLMCHDTCILLFKFIIIMIYYSLYVILCSLYILIQTIYLIELYFNVIRLACISMYCMFMLFSRTLYQLCIDVFIFLHRIFTSTYHTFFKCIVYSLCLCFSAIKLLIYFPTS